MFRTIVLSLIFIIFACSDSTTGSSFSQYSRVSVISTATGSIVANIEMNPTLNRRIKVTPDGRYAYVTSYDGDNIIQIDCLSSSISGGLDFGLYKHCMDLCLNDQGTGLCYVPVLDILYIGIANGLFESGIMVVDLPGLVPSDEIEISPELMDMAPDPSGDYVYCNIYMDNRVG